MNKTILFSALFTAFLLMGFPVRGEVCAVYFTGIGCPHCASAGPVVDEALAKHPELALVKYEIYQETVNAPLLAQYSEVYGHATGIPVIIFGKGDYLSGSNQIARLEAKLAGMESNPCPLIDGSSAPLAGLDTGKLPGRPEILGYNATEAIQPENGTIPAGSHAIPAGNQSGPAPQREELSVMKIVSLAAIDAINPCAFAVLTLMLVAIITYNPKKRKNILLAGGAFTMSVYVMYIFYGLVIIRSFQVVQALTSVRVLLYQALGAAAIILGVLNIKDFFRYKPGGIATEMPMRLRPKVKRIISGVTSPSGAFLVGMLVTLFLLPCTIGPYVIAGGILSAMEITQTIPWLMLYNFIFILPMAGITLLVYRGMGTVEDVSGWKDRNIRYLHLASGTVILLLGIGMLLGLV